MADEADLRSLRFRREREASWKALEEQITIVEASGAKALSPEDAMALAQNYRAAVSALSVARAISLDLNTRLYLEALCARAFLVVHGVREPLPALMARFFTQGFPAAVRASWRHVLVATLALFAGATVAYILTTNDMDWFSAFVSSWLAQGRTPAASTETLREALAASGEIEDLLSFSTRLFIHNAGVAIFAFALGFALGVPTLLLLFYNGLMLGAFYALYDDRGLGYELAAWLSIHGTTELTAIILAGAAGLTLGDAVAFPKRRSRMEELKAAGRRGAQLIMGAVFMLFIAGFLEGVGRQTIESPEGRLAVGLSALGVWLIYFIGVGRRPNR